MCGGKQDGRLGILDHGGNALRGKFGIDGNVGATGFQNRKQSDNHFRGAFYGNAGQNLGAHAELLQITGQLVRALIEFAVGEMALFAN